MDAVERTTNHGGRRRRRIGRRGPAKRGRSSLALAVVLAAVLVLSGLVAAPSSAQGYNATTGPLDIAFRWGCFSWVRGSGFAPGSTVDLTLSRPSTNVRQTRARANGSFSYLLIFNGGDTAGSQTLQAAGLNPAGGTHTLSARVTVRGYCTRSRWWPPRRRRRGGVDVVDPIAVIEEGGMPTDLPLTADNFDVLLTSFPPSPTSAEPISTQSTLPLAVLLGLVGAASWRMSREVDRL